MQHIKAKDTNLFGFRRQHPNAISPLINTPHVRPVDGVVAEGDSLSSVAPRGHWLISSKTPNAT